MSDMGGFLLIASVGAGVYSNTLKAKQKEFQDKLEEKYMKKTDHTVMAVPTKTVSLYDVKGMILLRYFTRNRNQLLIMCFFINWNCCHIKQKIAVAEPEVADSVDDTVEQEEPVVIEEEADEEVIEAIEEVTEEIIPTPAPVPPTSELVLKETEKAIAEVKAKGVQETKAKMSFNEPVLSPSSPTPEQVEEPKNDVITKKEKDPGTKKQIAQGITLIVAAAGVALARNVIKAWLGRGMF